MGDGRKDGQWAKGSSCYSDKGHRRDMREWQGLFQAVRRFHQANALQQGRGIAGSPGSHVGASGGEVEADEVDLLDVAVGQGDVGDAAGAGLPSLVGGVVPRKVLEDADPQD